MLFGASVRYNLDPFKQYDDERIWKALEQVIILPSTDKILTVFRFN